jgi:hypothetical protein
MKTFNEKYIQYGCGLTAPVEWRNFDISPTLQLQKIPVLGKLLKRKLNVMFPENVEFGDIVNGLPVKSNSCQGIYCSHTLEHLSLDDFRLALQNTYLYLNEAGLFRMVVPDLEFSARAYIRGLENEDSQASLEFLRNTMLGIEKRPKGVLALLSTIWGNSHHLWMWDYYSLAEELKRAGFSDIRRCAFGDCEDKMFTYVEDRGRFENALAVECRK